MGGQYRFLSNWYDVIIEPLIHGIKTVGLKMYPVHEDMNVLDVGCGTGTLLSLYQGYTNNIYGIDLSPSMIHIAGKKLGEKAKLRVGSATNMAFRNDQFDLITCCLLLHEVSKRNRIGILKEVKRVLRQDGRILLIDYHPGPNNKLKGFYAKPLITTIEFLAGREHYRNFRHFLGTGGLPGLIERMDLIIEGVKILGGGNFGIYILRK